MQLARSANGRAGGAGNRYVHVQRRDRSSKAKERSLLTPKPKAAPKAAPTPRGESCVSGRKVVLGFVLGVVLLTLVSAGLLAAYRFVTHSEYFSVQEVEVQGAMRLDPVEVAALTGITRGENALAVNMQAVEARLMAEPWVERVAVTRELPDRFRIRIVERMPHFWVRKDGQLWYADRFGQAIGEVQGRDFTSLPVLEVEAGGEYLAGALSQLVDMAAQRELPFALHEAAWVRLGAGQGLLVHFDDRNVTYGLDAGRMQESVESLNLVLRDLERRGERDVVRAVRVQGDRVWVSYAAGARP